MIKGEFVGEIKISLSVPDEHKGELLPFNQIQENWEEIAEHIREVLLEELGDEEDFFHVEVKEKENYITEFPEDERKKGGVRSA